MASINPDSSRILIVGGGFAGLSIAVRLTELGLPITLLEASSLGFDASSRNQGWLHSGALYAPREQSFAQACYHSLQYVQSRYPECIEAHFPGTIYLSVDPATNFTTWTTAWDQAGIPFEAVDFSELSQRLPHFEISQIQQAFLLPDRVMQPALLLNRLAEQAQKAGADIRTETTVTHLIKDSQQQNIIGAELGTGEIISAHLIVLATGALGANLWSEIAEEQPGHQTNYRRVLLKNNLTSIEPNLTDWPFCIFDSDGFNHMPHSNRSVFGLDHWTVVSDGEDYSLTESEKQNIWQKLNQFCPSLESVDYQVTEWAGRTVQALHIDQIEPGAVTRSTVIDHAQETPIWNNLLSVYPGRATLWPQLAEQTFEIVQRRIS